LIKWLILKRPINKLFQDVVLGADVDVADAGVDVVETVAVMTVVDVEDEVDAVDVVETVAASVVDVVERRMKKRDGPL
jgi:hypothetical protein